jgi:hypothetical protein
LIVFVSYSRVDHTDEELRAIEAAALQLGVPYIDDLHHDPEADRNQHVHEAMDNAGAFLVVLTENYLQTLWTRLELERAEKRDVPIYKLQDARITRSNVDEVRALANGR